MSNAYHVEWDDAGCEQCSAGRTWGIVLPGDDPPFLGASFESEAEADEWCGYLNDAYARGGQARLTDIRATYYHYRYLTEELSDLDKLIDYAEHNEDTALIVLYDCWRAIKAACEKEQL